jgi:hypothetical protein
MSGLEVEIGEWRISLPQAWTYLDGQTFTFFKSGPELGQFQISTARQVSGPAGIWEHLALEQCFSRWPKFPVTHPRGRFRKAGPGKSSSCGATWIRTEPIWDECGLRLIREDAFWPRIFHLSAKTRISMKRSRRRTKPQCTCGDAIEPRRKRGNGRLAKFFCFTRTLRSIRT